MWPTCELTLSCEINLSKLQHQLNFHVHSHKKLRSGERILHIIDSVEDSKGNAGDIGRVVISNLRLMWFSLTNPKFTLCKFNTKHQKKNETFPPLVSGGGCQEKHYKTSSLSAGGFCFVFSESFIHSLTHSIFLLFFVLFKPSDSSPS